MLFLSQYVSTPLRKANEVMLETRHKFYELHAKAINLVYEFNSKDILCLDPGNPPLSWIWMAHKKREGHLSKGEEPVRVSMITNIMVPCSSISYIVSDASITL